MQELYKISIVTPTFNEQENILSLIESVRCEMKRVDVEYEHIIIDNNSTDGTRKKISEVCSYDARVKLIANKKNFGQVISPVAGLFAATGDAVIMLAADFENPPSLIPEIIWEWRKNDCAVFGVISDSDENLLMRLLRGAYYSVVKALSPTDNLKNFNGYCLVPKNIVLQLKKKNTLYLFLRHEILEESAKYAIIEYKKDKRKHGQSKNNLSTLLDIAMLGFIAHNVNINKFMFFSGLFSCVISFIFYIIGLKFAAILSAEGMIVFALFSLYYSMEVIKYDKLQRDSRLIYEEEYRINFDT